MKVENFEITSELSKLSLEIKLAKDNLKSKINDRELYCRKNKRGIKKMFPLKNNIYQIKNFPRELRERWGQTLVDEIYYFKPTNTSFYISGPSAYYGFDGMPLVKGEILNSNYDKVGGYYYDELISIGNLIPIHPKKNPLKKQTYIYVMIDKNTGYYKIGRSVNPKQRERTLQSEKPTIEMLFNYKTITSHEKELHNMFKGKRIRGEWFDLSGSDIIEIKEFFKLKNKQITPIKQTYIN